MARFLALLLSVVALLLAAGRMGHAAPSTAGVFWRAVVPDSVLRRLRTDTSFVSEGMAGMAKGAGRSTSGLDYDDYTRLPPAAGNEAPFGYDYKAPSDGSEATNEPSEASEAREDDVPFNYSYKEPSKVGEDGGATATEAATSSSEASEETISAPYNYAYKAPRASKARGGGESTSQNKAGMEIVGAPFNYGYKAPSERRADSGATASEARGGRKATTTVFFHEAAVRVGERLHFHFPAAARAPLGLLPRHAADSIPFSTPALPNILSLFGVSPGSPQAAAMAETLRTCEWPALAGESKFCAASLEALVEGATATLGTRDVRAVTSTLPRAGAPLQPYTVRAVRRVDGASFVACHDEVYPYTVYRCHTTGPARAYMMEMEGASGAAVTVATVCHTDTSRWNPEHLSFKLLGTKPGGEPICHLMPYGHIIWAKNVKR